MLKSLEELYELQQHQAEVARLESMIERAQQDLDHLRTQFNQRPLIAEDHQARCRDHDETPF